MAALVTSSAVTVVAPVTAAELPERAASPASAAFSSISPGGGSTQESDKSAPGPHWIRYTSKGLQLRSNGESFTGKVNIRSQIRLSAPFRSAPRKLSHFERDDENDLRFRRARFKMDGQAGASWIKYKYEHDLVKGRLLDLRFDMGPEWLKLRVGQWKVDYSRERMDSSGKQQFTERSIVNRAFTLDRQKGASAVGRIGKGSFWDSQYFAGVFTGQGRGVFRERRVARSAADGSPMWSLRYQWNPLGGGVGLSQSDLERVGGPRLSVAVATAGNRSRYTRFSSSGGGRLDAYQIGLPGQYSIRQKLEEVAFKHRGLSIQHEWHWKSVMDRVAAQKTYMRGSYTQAGYFLNALNRKFPKQLEIAGRIAFVDPNTQASSDTIRELGAAVNWFFNGHADKITVDVGQYSLLTPTGALRTTVGVRTQWDVSF